MTTIGSGDREELRLTLHVIPGWKLSQDGWRTLESSLTGVRKAIESNDRVSFYRYLEEIGRAAPMRLARLSPDADAADGGSSSPPQALLELVNSLVHAPDARSTGAAP